MARSRHLPPTDLLTRRLPEALGQSEAFLAFQEHVSQAAQVDRPVLIVGERGTGKELVANRLHYLSRRWQAPLVPLNCAALAPSLLETELFGHESGAFTGAAHQRLGRFEAAHEGTLFLDEIGLVPLEVQEKILRAVEYGAFERVGSSAPIQVDVRIIGATNADLLGLVQAGRFKADLLDRLAFDVLHLPPLRERTGDIGLLARHFASKMAYELDRDPPDFSEVALQQLESYPWPGNVRELKNVVERAVYRSQTATITSVGFNPFPTGRTASTPQTSPAAGTGQQAESQPAQAPAFLLGQTPLLEHMNDLERFAIQQALEICHWHQGKAANLLGLTYHQFRACYRRHRPHLTRNRLSDQRTASL